MPADEYKQDESYCNVPCVGDSGVSCGGPQNAINVYELDDACTPTKSVSATPSTASTDGMTEEVVTASPITTSKV